MSSGRRLILVRHSTPEMRRDVPAAQWELSSDGVARAAAFARRIDPGSATAVFTSVEPKARATARALGQAWALPVEDVPGLHEHERPQAQMMSREEFEQRIKDLFARPDRLVFGAETAAAARRRFTAAVMRLVMRPGGDVIVVSHGTVMALFVAEATGVDPFVFWKSQQMPFAIVLAIPELTSLGSVFLRS